MTKKMGALVMALCILAAGSAGFCPLCRRTCAGGIKYESFRRLQKASHTGTHKASMGNSRRDEKMKLSFWLNGVYRHDDVEPDTLLLDFLRDKGCYSVKRGCETANCGLCTVLMDGKPVLSCSTLALRAEGKKIVTMEGMQKEAEEFGAFLADEGAEQCGFCNPGFIMNVFAMEKELENPSEEDVKEYLAGNLCRCSGFVGQTRSILKYLEHKKSQKKEEAEE